MDTPTVDLERRDTSPRTMLRQYVAMARPDHWFKNVFALPGTLAAIALLHAPAHTAWGLLLGLPAMCLIASANYVINEWIDRGTDAHHPEKRNRPSVAGSVTRRGVIIEYVLLAAIGLILSALISSSFLTISVLFLIQGLVYNVRPIRSKDRAYLDVLSESINNPLRFLWGWFIIVSQPLPAPTLTFGYWLAGAFLMTLKRYAEYRSIGDPEVAARYRLSFGRYTEEKLLVLALFCCIFCSFLLGVFMAQYRIEFVLSFPFFSLIFTEYFRLSMKADSPVQKPERLYREKRLMLLIAVAVLSVIVLLKIDLPWMQAVLTSAFATIGR